MVRDGVMFFHINLEKNIVLEPRHFGKNLQEVLREKLKNEVRPKVDRQSRS